MIFLTLRLFFGKINKENIHFLLTLTPFSHYINFTVVRTATLQLTDEKG